MTIDVAHVPPRFCGLWIALARDEQTLLGSGKTAEEAVKNAHKNGHNRLIVARVPGPEVPNETTLRAIAVVEKERANGTLKSFATLEDFMKDL